MSLEMARERELEQKSNCGIDTDPLFLATEIFKGHDAIYLGKQGVISASTNVGSRMNLGTNLSNQDTPGRDTLSTKPFYSPSLPCTIATISGTAARLFMRHDSLPFTGLFIQPGDVLFVYINKMV